MSWCVIICEAQRERKLGAAIAEAGREVFVPTYTAWRPKYGKYGEVTRALIPNYVFAILEPHEVHAFHNEGAIRVLPMNWRLSLRLAFKIQQYRELLETGALDEPKPAEPKPPKLPRPRRNRKARRQSGEAKRQAMEFKEGLDELLREMTAPQQVAA